MSTYVRDYWLSHPEYWLAVGDKRAAADREIYDTFQNYDFTQEDDFGIVVYLDQFMRHFSRITTVKETTIQECREHAAYIVTHMNRDDLMGATETELIFYLMPWKHLAQWSSIFPTIHSWLSARASGTTIVAYPKLNRFFMDTYKKAYTATAVMEGLVLSSASDGADTGYDPHAICESHPALYGAVDAAVWRAIPVPESAKPLLTALRSVLPESQEPMTISLSGGVDSMLMAALLRREGYDVVAAHIVYGNREESVGERNFVARYCRQLGIPLYLYTVEWLRRDSVDRAFYEEMTRELRFAVYRALERPVFLGHIQEDVVENIWTNFARGTHLDDLGKFRPVVTESGVQICRPWLHIRKADIYAVAAELAIPHLKNTTPSWSNRGKFRAHFYAATHAQFETSVDDKVLEVADRLTKQAALLDKLLYTPIRDSWDGESIDITLAIQHDVDAEGWQRILTDLAHSRLGIGKPSIASCQNFRNRIQRETYNGQRMTLRKDFVVCIRKTGGQIRLCSLLRAV